MSTKIANIIFMILIIALGIGYWISALSLQDDGDTMGPEYFPVLLAIILIILSIISLIQTLFKKENDKFEIPKLRLILLTIVVIGLLILSWNLLRYFYIHLFIFLLFLILAYKLPKFNIKILVKDSAIALVITILTYLIFNILLGMDL